MPKPRGILTSKSFPKIAPAILPSDGEKDIDRLPLSSNAVEPTDSAP